MQVLHDRLLDKVLSLPMSFFDTQPSGRLISRFSKDVQSTDLTLPGLMLGLSDCIIGTIVSTAVVAGTTRGAVLAAVGLLVPMYMSVQRKYLATSRELNRLQSVTSSPILTNFGETLAGLITVRAFGKQVRLFSSDLRLLVSFSRWLDTHAVHRSFCLSPQGCEG
jgi:ABC-type multidrug transport system fused ATPase/permease subunit